ncbi:DUF3833 domain-containing protein [Rhodovibrionaceae bacterium A322]
MIGRFLALLFSFFFLSACGPTMTVQDFETQQPRLVLEEYFEGRTVAYGLFEDRFGNVRNQFSVIIDGTWDGKVLSLDENFSYFDGETEYRRWEIEKLAENKYVGTTENIIGEAYGETAGNSFNWKYKFKLKVGDGIWNVRFDDWMFLQPDGVLLNKATVYRWGFKVGTVFLSFHRAQE